MRKGRLPIVLGVCAALAVIIGAAVVLSSSPRSSTAVVQQEPVVAHTVQPGVDHSGPGATPPPTGAPPPTPQPSPTDFDVVDQATARFLTRDARWQVPDTLDVDRTARIGLAVGSGQALTSGIKNLLPSTSPISAGTVQVGPTVAVTLRADPDDAIVTPSDKISASTGSDVQMLWTWLVHPLRPTMALLLTADIELPLSNGYVIRNEFALSLQVRRTLAYTARQIFTNWATWSAIGATSIGIVGWLYRRKRRQPPRHHADDVDQSADVAVQPQSTAAVRTKPDRNGPLPTV
jgi:hypothetical protein